MRFLPRATDRIMRRAALIPGGLALALVALTGCTSSDGQQIATAGGAAAAPQASASPTDTADVEEQRLAFARCMRDNGVPMPDPGSGSGPGSGFRALGDEVDQDTMDAALSACESLRPSLGGRTRQDLSEADKQVMLDMAQCLRDEGYDVADPTFDGRGGFLRPDPSSSINPRDEDFRAAMESCSDAVGWSGFGDRRGPEGAASPTTTAPLT